MYSIVDSDESSFRLITEDFTIAIKSEIGISDRISSSVVNIDYDGREIIVTDTEERAYSYYDSHPITSRCIYIPYRVFRSVLDILSEHNCCVPHSEQTKIMELLGEVLY
jgi:hypothetical protein